jgi:hypothetical protein
LRNSFATMLLGFVIGVGFCVAASGACYFAYQYFRSTVESGSPSMVMSYTEPAPKEIILSDVEERNDNGRVSIIGTLKNTGARPARGVQIEVDLFQKGKFVDQYSTYIAGSIAPGESRNFKVACGCKDTPPAEHDSFKAQVRGGF